jgi:hypothetical protein
MRPNLWRFQFQLHCAARIPIKLVERPDFKLICLIGFFHNCSVAGQPGKELDWPARKLSGSSDFIWR